MIEQFSTYLRACKGYSENTIKAYSKDLHTFARWARETNVNASWSTITRDDIDAYLTYQQRQGLAAATTNRHLAAISSLYNFFRRQGHDLPNPCKYESRRKIGERVPVTIPVSQFKEAYSHSTGTTKAMLGLLATTGIRIQELLDITFEDINQEESTIIIKGKGNKERTVQTEPHIIEDIISSSTNRPAIGKVFHFNQRTARYLIFKALSPYCTSRQLSPHIIRHTYATELAKNGENAMTIAKALGHNQIKTSQKYVDMTQLLTPTMGICLTK